jgi:hypothetical protein
LKERSGGKYKAPQEQLMVTGELKPINKLMTY